MTDIAIDPTILTQVYLLNVELNDIRNQQAAASKAYSAQVQILSKQGADTQVQINKLLLSVAPVTTGDTTSTNTQTS